ncbi:MAG: NAD(P)-dependent oxidoreductase, partial [Actinomycetota bacterium]
VGDVAEGVARCCLADPVPTAPVPLGTGALHSIREVVETLVATTGSPAQPRFGSMADRSDEVVRAADVDRTRSQLGWAPSTTLAEGLAATVDWYRRHRTGAPVGG